MMQDSERRRQSFQIMADWMILAARMESRDVNPPRPTRDATRDAARRAARWFRRNRLSEDRGRR